MKTLFLNCLFSITTISLLIFSISSCNLNINKDETKDPPNILWIVSEDNSPFFGCYGDEFATTPTFDKLASEGVLYENAFANAPVCAPARNTIITGVYANSAGNQHMRSKYPASETLTPLPLYLRQLGYYCTNNSKIDYNTNSFDKDEIWDESNFELLPVI